MLPGPRDGFKNCQTGIAEAFGGNSNAENPIRSVFASDEENNLNKFQLDHEHLNFVIPEFKTTVPTTENILLYFEKKILSLKLKNQLAFIKLFEMENLYSEKYYVTVY